MSTTTTPSTERDHYLATFEREYQTTLRVLKAYPANKSTYKASERSPEATAFAWILVISQMVTEPIQMLPELSPKDAPKSDPPKDWNTIVTMFEQAHKDATKRLTAMSDDVYKSTIIIPVGPGGATAPVRRADALWMMLFDTVHHRGQLSVYLRAVGGKVPSIYGGSGDEPWF